MYRDAKLYCLFCETCQYRKPKHIVTRMPLQPIQVSGILDKWGVDIVGPIRPASIYGHRYILVFTEYLSRWAEAWPLREISADTVAKCFIEGIVCRYGPPTELLSDRGSQFLSDVMKSACTFLTINKQFTTSYRPNVNGLTERFNGTLVQTLAKYATDQQLPNWSDFIPFALFAYRNSIQSSLKDTPFFLLFGKDCRSFSPNLTAPSKYIIDIDAYKYQMQLNLHRAREQAKQELITAQSKQKLNYDKRVKLKQFEIGDLVLLFNPVLEEGISPKFHQYWKGIFRIILIKLPYDAIIRKLGDPEEKTQLVHFDRLKHFYTDSSSQQ